MITKEDIETIKELLSATKELNGEYQDGWDDEIEKGEKLVKKMKAELDYKIKKSKPCNDCEDGQCICYAR